MAPLFGHIDHKKLENLQTAKRLNSRQARWSLFTRFAFPVTYRPGTKNVRTDTVSHQHHTEAQSTSLEPVLSRTCFLATLRWDLDRKITAANPHPHCPPERLFVPLRHRRALIAWANTSVGTGHPEATHITQLLSARYWWPAMSREVVR
ncbi:hypothetical protein P4O66_005401 [Electrophorus voltai]|uniref:Integrase zinc-binding domain-containing protein n=1 Tax=Electrophorus voltai TaxID=2609070 RepID=A0AAD8ZX59_9TELE|nr:hypothetical protein P4O66_005401 [Electrophorus voltai]